MFKKITFTIIIIMVLSFLIYVGYVIFGFISFSNTFDKCGMNDGPFTAQKIESEFIENKNDINLKLENKYTLIIQNRTDSLSPLITLKKSDKVEWTLDTNVRFTQSFESSFLSRIENVTVEKSTEFIELRFTGYWTYGAESGYIRINRNTAENFFCLSW